MFNRSRPKLKPKVGNPTADFALKFDMITKEEHTHILRGDMFLIKFILTNLNADLPYLRTGEDTTIYQGRASDIMINRLLDI